MNFFNHPIIDAIVHNPWSTQSELFINSSINSQKTFQKELEKLIEDGHLRITNQYYAPRYNYLCVMYKNENKEFTKIDIKYIPAIEIHRSICPGLTFKNFNSTIFNGRITLNKTHQPYLQKLVYVPWDFDKYDYQMASTFLEIPTENDLLIPIVNVGYKEIVNTLATRLLPVNIISARNR